MFLFGLKSAITGAQPETEPSPVDVVSSLIYSINSKFLFHFPSCIYFHFQVGKLADRVTTSTFLEDKREACRELKCVSKKHRVEVGAHALSALTEVLLNRPDSETLTHVLETLENVMSPEVFEEEGSDASCGAQFTEIFLKKFENVTSVIDVLEEYDFRVRLPAIRLLMNLLTNQ